MTARILSLLFLLHVIACDQVQVRPKAGLDPVEKIQSFEGPYVKDGKGGLFQNLKWYEYEMATHIIWPLHDVFAIRTSKGLHKIQIRSYYDEAGVEAGLFRMGWGTSAGQGREVLVDARACGNPFTNPDHAGCLADPSRNVFTYWDLDTQTSRRMTESQALQDKDWDVAFRGTDVKLNSGTSGPGQVVGALLKRFDFFLGPDGRPDPVKLRALNLQSTAALEFMEMDPRAATAFYLPDGIDRVIHESMWFQVDGATGFRKAQPQNWWVLQANEDTAFVKMRIADIAEELRTDPSGDEIHSEIVFEFQTQDVGATEFATEVQKLSVQISSVPRTLQLCVSLLRSEIWVCQADRKDWDIRLLVANQRRAGILNREWRIFVSRGGKGPLDSAAAAEIRSGLAKVAN